MITEGLFGCLQVTLQVVTYIIAIEIAIKEVVICITILGLELQ